MKKIILLIFSLCMTVMLHAITVNSTAGGLATAITNAGGNLSTLTDLTVTGVIDGRDFVTIRNNIPGLSSVDLSGVTIAASSFSAANEIPDNAFSFCIGLTSVTIPSSVTAIGDNAFFACVSLSSIDIPSLVTSIGNDAFSDCSALITVDANNPNYSSIDGVLFNKNQTILIHCPRSKTGSYIIPSSVTSVEDEAFYGCFALTSISIPSSVTSIIGRRSFSNCSGLIIVDANNPNYSSIDGVLFNKSKTILINCPTSKTGSYTIPSSVTSIGEGAFVYCLYLTSITIPSSVTSIGDNTFYYCIGLTSINLPSSMTSIGEEAFWRCQALTSINLPSSLTSIGDQAFEDCSSLTSITIPSSVTSIGNSAFYGCQALTSINIPSSVTSIGERAFRFSSGLITVDTNNPNYSSVDGVLFNKNQTTLIYCPTSKTGRYTIPSSVTSIRFFAFSNCKGLTSISIPFSVTSIEDDAFYACENLKSIYAYPTTPVDLIDSDYAFYGVDKTTCTLYVPKNSLDLYKTADQWQDFVNIEEMWGDGVSIEEVDLLNIYPNPATDAFSVSGLEEVGVLNIVDLNGKTLLTQQVAANDYVSIDSLPTGLYIVKITTDGVTIEKKLMKK